MEAVMESIAAQKVAASTPMQIKVSEELAAMKAASDNYQEFLACYGRILDYLDKGLLSEKRKHRNQPARLQVASQRKVFSPTNWRQFGT
jgi:hypothetical protein